jgi:hypothetical protein
MSRFDDSAESGSEMLIGVIASIEGSDRTLEFLGHSRIGEFCHPAICPSQQ